MLQPISWGDSIAYVSCDECDYEETYDIEVGYVNFDLFKEDFTIKKIDGDWCHFCDEDCYLEYKKR